MNCWAQRRPVWERQKTRQSRKRNLQAAREQKIGPRPTYTLNNLGIVHDLPFKIAFLKIQSGNLKLQSEVVWTKKSSILTSNNLIKKFSITPTFYTLLVRPNFGCSTKKIYSGLKKFETPHEFQTFLFNNHDLVDLQESNERIQKSSENFFKMTKHWNMLSWKSFFWSHLPWFSYQSGIFKKM